MGNTSSELTQSVPEDIWWNPRQATHTMDSTTQTQSSTQSLNELKLELERKHERRRQIIAEKQKEMLNLRQEVEKYKKDNEELKNLLQGETQFPASNLRQENEDLKLEVEHLKLQLTNSADVAARNKELRISVANMQAEVQNVNSELIAIEEERLEYGKHISALKDVVRVTKDMLLIRENQIQDLKNKVNSVEELLASKEMKIMSDELREEYEKQLKNIRSLRVLYEERQRLDKRDKDKLQDQLDETKKLVEDEQKKSSELQERIIELENDNSKKYDTILNLQSNLGLSKAECKELQAEIDVINQLFSQILLGFNSSQEIDLDKMIKILEENHDLLTNIVTNEVSNSTTAALPKLLLDLINQMDKNTADTIEGEASGSEANLSSDKNQVNSAEEIVENLPKVWKILIELLSQHTPPSNILHGNADLCYKSVETPSGPKLKLSVSQTFIRLKDLILEKKFLERETYRLKHLNTHLESRLGDQEKRLELVSSELTNTWHVVGKMQRQHQQLHTHEKVLRYELQQKRKLLNELKEELQYARDKWVMAREKNDTTQEQWKELRKEFAARKVNDDFNQSAESGYSDDKDTSEDERGYESDVSDVKREHDLELEPSHELSCTNKVIHSDENTETELVQNSSERQSFEVQSNYSKSVTETEEIVDNSECSTSNGNKTEEILSTKPEADILRKPRSTEEIFAARDERLKRLEEQSKSLLVKVTNTTQKSVNLSNKLDNLHEIYGEQSTNNRLSVQTQSTSETTSQTLPTLSTFTQSPLTSEKLSPTPQTVSTHLSNRAEHTSTGKIEAPESTSTRETLLTEDTLKLQCSESTQSSLISEASLTQSQSTSETKTQPIPETVAISSTSIAYTRSSAGSSSETFLTQSPPTDEIVKRKSESTTEQLPSNSLVMQSQSIEIRSETLPSETVSTQSISETVLKESLFTSETSPTNQIVSIQSTDVIVSPATSSTSETVSTQSTGEILPIQSSPMVTSDTSESQIVQTTEERLQKRDERLKRLEEQCKQLVTKVTNTSQKSTTISNKLDNLHETYGESSATGETTSANDSDSSKEEKQ